MDCGIALMGLNGAGKSTIAHALATRLGCFEMDVEDYYFPEQRASRREAVRGVYCRDQDNQNVLPFSHPSTKAEVEAALLADMIAHPGFVLAGVTMNWGTEILDKIGMAFYIEAPLEIRLQRIENREMRRFGGRVLPGGDMFDQQRLFRRQVEEKRENVVEESAGKLSCPVIRLNGMEPIEDNVKRILAIVSML